MARELWLLRHGDAEDEAPAGGGDAARRLSPKGEEESERAGLALGHLGLEFEHVFASPRVRAIDSARIAGEALGAEPVVHDALAGGFDARQALELLATVRDGGRLLLVGHNPDMAQVVYDLTGANARMPTGGVAGIAVDGGSAELLALLRPRVLRLMAGR
jgi:phosphohistidine phosphatase